LKRPLPPGQPSDRASEVAEFLFGYEPREGLNQKDRRGALSRVIRERFPGITDDELIRGYQIATELMRADTIELNAETAKLKAELQRRRKAEANRFRARRPK